MPSLPVKNMISEDITKVEERFKLPAGALSVWNYSIVWYRPWSAKLLIEIVHDVLELEESFHRDLLSALHDVMEMIGHVRGRTGHQFATVVEKESYHKKVVRFANDFIYHVIFFAFWGS
jgi:hypothetical protein